DQVADRVSSFVDPASGRRPVARVWRREELFKGRFADDAPDLLLQPAPLFSLSHAKAEIADADWLSGEHRIEGVFAAAGPHVERKAIGEAPLHLVDVAPTILAAVGVPSSVRHSGAPIASVVG